MLTQVFSMGLSLVLLWHGRDKVWTPTFNGTRPERFAAAVLHYQERMGLEDAVVLYSAEPRIINGRARCAWAWRDSGFEDDIIGLCTSKRCDSRKPEELALHEQCHRRMAHLEPAFWGVDYDTKEREVRECMIAYSAKERR